MAGQARWQTLLKSAVSAGYAERLRIGIVVVLVSFDIEKRESRFAVAHSEIESRVGREFFDDELLKRRAQRRGKRRQLGFG